MSAFRLPTASREHAAGVIVASLASTLGVALIQGTALLQAAISANSITGNSRTVAELLQVSGVAFILLALYAGAVVTTNTFAMIVAGRTAHIALRRLLGSTARQERRAIAREGLQVGAIGGAVGLAVGTAAVAALSLAGRLIGQLEGVDYSFLNPFAVLPAVAVVPTTWLAAIVGSKGVLAVTPTQAVGRSQEPSEEESKAGRIRSTLAVLLIVGGSALLFGGVGLGLRDIGGFLVAFLGGLVSFTGFVLGGHLVIPRALRVTGRVVGTSPAARLAAENAVRYPLRSTRSTIGLLISVTLITTFGTGLSTVSAMLRAAAASGAERYDGIDESLTTTIVVFSVLTALSATVAAAGLVNMLSLSIVQRTRELGLLRALGFSRAQVKLLILTEGAQLVLTAIAFGLALGAIYGWAGAHALLGSQENTPGLLFISIPWTTFIAIVIAGIGLTLAATALPARRAVSIEPVAALATD